MDWIISDKEGESALTDDYQDLMDKQFKQIQSNGGLNSLELLFVSA